ncbi:MAG TPA: glucose-6-phosphate dehydrogenase [Nocardioidaceae bacterium]|nr:glucose-6-phosphate dehydrogenase [Nocardioidaceae bacterium]
MIGRMVVLGASGDLTSRLLLPAVAQLAEADLLPPGFSIVGAANVEWTTEDFRQHVATELDKHSNVPATTRDAVLGMLSFRPADVTLPEEVRALLVDDGPDTLVYLALPPFLIEPVLTALAGTGLRPTDAVAIEKPFGNDLASARHLNELLRIRLPEPTIFRVDHFLSDELVRRVVTLRFLNRIFEPTWNAVHVERVDISWLESLTLEGRAGYYDGAGALKDMVQNHLMEVMALVLMEQPARLDADSFRGARVEALRAVATPSSDDIVRNTVRARYTAGAIGSRQVPSYVDEPGVDRNRSTETYASVTVEVENPRWAGVPFTLRSGKALPDDTAEIAIHFRPLPRYLLDRWPGVEPNVLRLGLNEPYVRLATTLNGPGRRAENHDLKVRAPASRRTAYANLILNMLDRDATLFIRGDEAEESWRIIDPVTKAWDSGDVPMQEYAAGESPPGPVP